MRDRCVESSYRMFKIRLMHSTKRKKNDDTSILEFKSIQNESNVLAHKLLA
jgi:hypothetical protein